MNEEQTTVSKGNCMIQAPPEPEALKACPCGVSKQGLASPDHQPWCPNRTRPAEDRKADDLIDDADKLLTQAEGIISALTAERDALQAQMGRLTKDKWVCFTTQAGHEIYWEGRSAGEISLTERLTSSEAVEAANERFDELVDYSRVTAMRDALAAALHVAKGEG